MLSEQPQYQKEMWTVPKDVIYASIQAIHTALGYMPQIKTDVPQWKKALNRDITQMQNAVNALQNLTGCVPKHAKDELRPGWRWVKEGETLLATDEVFFEGEWSEYSLGGDLCRVPERFQRRIENDNADSN